MTAALGSLIVEVAANVARFQSDMGKVAQIAESRMRQVDQALGLVRNSLKTLGVGFAVGLTLDKVKGQIDGAIASAAGMQQLAERTGGTVEKLSGLASIAKLSGTETDALAGGLQKLSKAMVDAQNGGKTTSAAFTAIGISAKDLKGLRPDDTFQLIAQKMALYADGADKTAVAQALLGKSGANLLPVMKDLADAGELQAKVTAHQAAMADEFEKNQKRLAAAQGALYKIVAMELLPIYNAFTLAMLESVKANNGVKASVSALARDNSLRDWAENAAIAIGTVVEAMQGLLKFVGAIGGSFQAVYADLQFLNVVRQASPQALGRAIMEGTGPVAEALAKRNAVVEAANKRYQDLLSYDGTAFTRRLREQFAMNRQRAVEDRGFDPTGGRPAPKFNPNAEIAAANAQAYNRLTAEIAKYNEESDIMADTAHKVADYDKWAAEMKARLAAETDKLTVAQRRNIQAAIVAAAASRQDAERIKKSTEMEAEMQRLLSDKGLVGEGKNPWTERQTAATKYLQGITDETRNAEELVNGSFQRMEDAIVNFAKTGKLSFSDLFSFMAEQYIRQLIRMGEKKLLTDAAGNFSLGSVFSAVGSLFTGHANGLSYVPYDNYPALLHEGEKVLTRQEAAATNNFGGAIDASVTIGSVGAGVSRGEMMAAVRQAQAATEASIRRKMAAGTWR